MAKPSKTMVIWLRDDKLPSSVGNFESHYKGPHSPTSTMEWNRGHWTLLTRLAKPQPIANLQTFWDYVHLVGKKTWSAHSELQVVISLHLFWNLLQTLSCLAVSPKEVLRFTSAAKNQSLQRRSRQKTNSFTKRESPGETEHGDVVSIGCSWDLWLGLDTARCSPVRWGCEITTFKQIRWEFVEAKGTASTQIWLRSGKLI